MLLRGEIFCVRSRVLTGGLEIVEHQERVYKELVRQPDIQIHPSQISLHDNDQHQRSRVSQAVSPVTIAGLLEGQDMAAQLDPAISQVVGTDVLQPYHKLYSTTVYEESAYVRSATNNEVMKANFSGFSITSIQNRLVHNGSRAAVCRYFSHE